MFSEKTFLPNRIIMLIEGLTSFKFKSAKEALYAFNNEFYVDKKVVNITRKEAIDYNKLLTNIQKNIIDSIICEKDILACDPMGDMTNRYSLSYGVFGILYAVKFFLGSYTNDWLDMVKSVVHRFMCEFHRNPQLFSRGLYVGLAGIAYILLELEYVEEAKVIMKEILQRKTIVSDYAYGNAGVIPVLLKFYENTKDENYLKEAVREADCIITKAIIENDVLIWKDTEKDSYSGLTRGGSGIALSLLQLYLFTQEKKYLQIGEMALQADLKKMQITEKGFIGIDSKATGAHISVFSPYIHNGLAGIGCTLVRYYNLTKKQEYLDTINEIVEACTSEFVLYTGYLRGVVGLLSFFQDCLYILKLQSVKKNIAQCYEMLDYHYIEVDEKNGYVGDGLYKISHDLHTGSAGVLLIIARGNEERNENPFIVYDEIFATDKE